MSNQNNYYTSTLSAERLKICYDIAPPRVRQYLEAELHHVLQRIRPGDTVLELGCGYGRLLPALAGRVAIIIGIDAAFSSLLMGRETLSTISHCHLVQMDAVHLAFRDSTFDTVVCIQNGISAFHIDQLKLIRESIRVTKPGGLILFSSYSEKFWQHRLEWFQLQSKAGLLGEIDTERTRNGVIVCKDGFTATTVGPDQFLALTSDLNIDARILEVDESSVFYEIVPHKQSTSGR